EETGIYFYRARQYDPEIGRFLQRDRIGYYDSMNLYQYVGRNPVNWVDPMGLVRGPNMIESIVPAPGTVCAEGMFADIIGFMNDPQIIEDLTMLWVESEFILKDKELGGFILVDEEGNYYFEEWPREWLRGGTIKYPSPPDNYVADVHTHPSKISNSRGPRASNDDRQQLMWHPSNVQIIIDSQGVYWNRPRGGFGVDRIGNQPEYGK
ncbi:MAG: RHS repeat-associated core domain-containing protein, partial [Melioribacteraceae bacterium]|nr:RHS repeat-associated core domain-containing protein [Melioribacteraceae bacterium]